MCDILLGFFFANCKIAKESVSLKILEFGNTREITLKEERETRRSSYVCSLSYLDNSESIFDSKLR